MKLIDRFGLDKALNFVTTMRWMVKNGYTLEDLEGEIESYMESQRKSRIESLEEERKIILSSPKMQKIIPLCPKDKFVLRIVESPKDEYESELHCQVCGYMRYSDRSVVDINTEISEKVTGKDPEFKSEEIRVSKEERARRRAICKVCEYLNGKTCKKCGCSMKHRTYYEILNCPD